MYSFSAVLMSGWLRQNFNRNTTNSHHQQHHRQQQQSSSNHNNTHTNTTHHETAEKDTSTSSSTTNPSDSTTAAGIIIGSHSKGRMTGQEACSLARKLFDRMRKSGANPDARLLFRIAQLADVGNDVHLMSKVLTLAHQNSHVSANYALFQPHTKWDLPHSSAKGGSGLGSGLEKGQGLGDGPAESSKAMDQNTTTNTTTKIIKTSDSSSALEKTLQDLNGLTAHMHHNSEHDIQDHDNQHDNHHHHSNKNTSEISSSSSSSSAHKASWSLLTHTDLAKLYRLGNADAAVAAAVAVSNTPTQSVSHTPFPSFSNLPSQSVSVSSSTPALDCARSAKRPGRVKMYLITLTESHIPLSNRK